MYCVHTIWQMEHVCVCVYVHMYMCVHILGKVDKGEKCIIPHFAENRWERTILISQLYWFLTLPCINYFTSNIISTDVT